MVRSFKIVVAITLIAFALSSCAFIFPKQAALKDVHEAYRTEFASAFLGNAGVDKVWCHPKIDEKVGSFPKTLQAIREYEVKYPEESAEKKHLAILKAMIHLQVGNTGIARGMIKDLSQFSLEGADGRPLRDELFRKAFEPLVDGWEQVCDLVNKYTGGVYAGGDSDKLSVAAEGILSVIKPDGKPIKITEPAVDAGAIYLATTAAIFYYYAHRVEYDTCKAGLPSGVDCNDKVRENMYLHKAYTAIGMFLGVDEKKAASDPAWFNAIPLGRIAYVRWYGHLRGKAEAAGQL